MSETRIVLEDELLKAQIDKTRLEAKALQKSPIEKVTAAFIEGVKVVGALLVGAVGLVTGIQGFERAKQAKDDADKAIELKQIELQKVEQNLTTRSKDLSNKESALISTKSQLEVAAAQLEKIKAEIAALPKSPETINLQSNLESLDGSIGRAYVDSGTELQITPNKVVSETLDMLIEGLFASNASQRGASYQKLMSGYGSDPKLIASLLRYASSNKSNSNGIYNTLIVLSHIDYSKQKDANLDQIKSFAESVRANGEKTSQRVDVLLGRLPK